MKPYIISLAVSKNQRLIAGHSAIGPRKRGLRAKGDLLYGIELHSLKLSS